MLKTQTILAATLLTAGFLCLTNVAKIAAQTSGQELEFPYQALVLSDRASVHSGPGQVHYETEELKQGEAVEVYRHDPGEWCAIRPLAGSFSLVPESTLKIISRGVGEIKADGTQAWVGTKLGPVDKPLWQVKLKKGEKVEVVGQVSWPNPEGHSTVWYQISPPAGEFRWIKMSDLQLPVSARLAIKPPTKTKPPIDLATAVRSRIDRSPAALTLPSTGIETAQLGDAELDPIVSDSKVQLASMQFEDNSPRVSSNRGWRQATRPIRNRAVANNSNSSSYQREQYESSRPGSYSGAPGTPSSYGKSPDINYQPQTRPARVPNRYADASPSRRNLARSLNDARAQGGGFPTNTGAGNLGPVVPVVNNFTAPTIVETHRIDDLELQLTREMLRDPNHWKLEDLEFRAANISRMTTDPNEKILAEKFLQKIRNCRTIKFGFESQSASKRNSGGGGPSSGSSTTNNLGSSTTNNLGSATTNNLGSSTTNSFGSNTNNFANTGSNLRSGATYDAHGWLNQMVTDGGQGNPSYVLQDANGKITHHVSPIQGMNLHRYLRSKVGIIGQRGYHKRLNLDHVTAHRVVELQKRR